MRLLVLDTSGDACSIGVATGEGMAVLRSAEVGRAHAERLMPMVAEAVAASGLAFADLDRIAVTVGPGSFTGVRIGIAAARGLALATGTQAVGIGTLAAHAEAARAIAGAVPVVVALAASRGEVVVQRFVADGTAEGAPLAGPPDAFAALLDDGPVLAGSGADALAGLRGDRRLRIVHRDRSPNISAVLRLAEGAPRASLPPKPIYLRAPDARPQEGARVARR